MSEGRTIDHPTDVAIREQQARERAARGKALGARVDELVKPRFSPAYTFRFRQYKNTQFAGLWELCAMRPDGKIDEMITDADSLPETLEAIGNIFANEGY